jgi:hypothetical protein
LPPDPPAEIEWSDPVLQISFAAQNYSYANTLLYQDAVNSDTLKIRDLVIAPGEARIRGFSIVEKQAGGITYDQVTIEIVLRFRYKANGQTFGGWDPVRLLNADLKQINAAGKLVDCVDGDGQPTTRPMPLDANGKQLTTAQIQAGNAYTYQEYTGYREQPFRPLGFFG